MDILNEICGYIIYSSIVASFIAIVIMLLKLVFKNRFNANWHYYIWFIVILRLMVMELPSSELSIFNFWDTSKVTNVFKEVSEENYITDNAYISNSMQGQNSDINLDAVKSNDFLKMKLYLKNIVPIAWLLGFCAIMLVTMISYFIFLYKINKFGKVSSDELIFLLDECKENLNVRKKVRIYYSDIVNTPTVLGVINKKILIPTNLDYNLSKNEMIHIINHELCHIKRYDIEMNFIMMILQSAHWFNPILWVTFNKIKSDCEVACDELVLKSINNDNVKVYGETIIKLASLVKGSKQIRLNLAAVDKKNVKRRIVMISKFKKKSIIISIASLILIGVICLVCLTNPKEPTNSNVTAKVDSNEENSNKDEAEINKDEEVKEPEKEENVVSNVSTTTKEESKPVAKSNNQNNSKQQSDKVYKSKKHNITFTIPASWEGKYVIEEYESEIVVNYILQDPEYKGELKSFLGFKDKEAYGDTSNMSYERIPNAPEEITVNGKKYLITSPTDTVSLYDQKEYQKMIKEAYKVVKSAR